MFLTQIQKIKLMRADAVFGVSAFLDDFHRFYDEALAQSCQNLIKAQLQSALREGN
jgi:hypothetical protein